MFRWVWIHCIKAKHHKMLSYLNSSLINATTKAPMVCVASRDYTIHLHLSTQQITNLIRCGVATGVTPTYNTTNTTNKLYLNSSYAMFHAIKLLKLLCFSAVLLYRQLPSVLYPNISNINFIPITIPFATHVNPNFYS